MSSVERNDPSVLVKAFRLLDLCGQAGSEMRLSELARASGIPKSTVHRLVDQLIRWGGLERNGKFIRLGPHLFELGALVSHSLYLRQAALPFMQDLYEATHETVHLGVLDNVDVLYIDKICGHQTPAQTRVGGRMPASCTGLGKAILAFSSEDVVEHVIAQGLVARTHTSIIDPDKFRAELETIAHRAVAFDHEEAHTGLSCVAAVILGRHGRSVGAVSVAGPTRSFDPDRFAHATRLSAIGISRTLSRMVPVPRSA